MRTGGRAMNESAKRAIKSIAFIFVFSKYRVRFLLEEIE